MADQQNVDPSVEAGGPEHSAAPEHSGAPEHPAASEHPEGQPLAFLVFRVSHQWLALPVELVEEVAAWVEPAPVPLAPRYLPGLVAQRGQALPLFDVASFLGLAPVDAAAAPAEESARRIVVVSCARMRVGIPCEQVRGVAEVRSSELRPPEGVQGEQIKEHVTARLGGTESLVLVLDLPRLLEAGRVRA